MTAYLIGGGVVALMVGGSIARHRKARRKVAQVVADKCTGCGLCVKRCRHKALDIIIDDSGRRVAAVVAANKCTACNGCVEVCKFGGVVVGRRG